LTALNPSPANPFLLPVLYPILDASILPVEPPARASLLRSIVAELIAAGVTLLQYRNKSGSDAQILADCGVVRAALASERIAERCLLILNDRADLAARVGFDGVHVGQGDISPSEARAIVGAGRIVGVSTHDEEQLQRADQTSADYLAIGPVFVTTSKERADPVVGLEGVRRARALTSKPLVAIGGITLANCRSVREAGADSVAVISSLFRDRPASMPTRSLEKAARDFFVNLR
jgi:thiamine-phosphate pyrophosphorylase